LPQNGGVIPLEDKGWVNLLKDDIGGGVKAAVNISINMVYVKPADNIPINML